MADESSGDLQAAIDGFAAGALLVMLIDSMIPEAGRQVGTSPASPPSSASRSERASQLLQEARGRAELEQSADKAVAARETLDRVRTGAPRRPARPATRRAPPLGDLARPGRQGGLRAEVLGPGVNAGVLPMPSELAQLWISRHGLPAGDPDLARVSELLAIEYDPSYPRELLQKELFDAPPRPEGPIDSSLIYRSPSTSPRRTTT